MPVPTLTAVAAESSRDAEPGVGPQRHVQAKNPPVVRSHVESGRCEEHCVVSPSAHGKCDHDHPRKPLWHIWSVSAPSPKWSSDAHLTAYEYGSQSSCFVSSTGEHPTSAEDASKSLQRDIGAPS